MKKILTILLSLLILSSNVFAYPTTVGFTHPEIGEHMTVGFENNFPFFQIYGFYYYQFADIKNGYRSIKPPCSFADVENSPDVSSTFEAMLRSVENDLATGTINKVTYIGSAEIFRERISNLPISSKVKALEALFGFSGVDGYNHLSRITGFSSQDITLLKGNYFDYHININKKVFPFRLFVQYIEEKSWDQSYFERYSFIKINDEWRLLSISREYSNAYKERTGYIHGHLGADINKVPDLHDDLLLGVKFGTSKDLIISAVPSAKLTKNILKFDTELFFLPVKAEFIFKNEALSKVKYSFSGTESYYSVFISLYMRYIDPVLIDKSGKMVWSLNDVLITLDYNDANPVLTVENMNT